MYNLNKIESIIIMNYYYYITPKYLEQKRLCFLKGFLRVISTINCSS